MNGSFSLRACQGRLWTAALLAFGLALFPCAARAQDQAPGISGKVEIYDQNHKSVADKSNVVVYLEEVNGNKGFTPPSETPKIVSRDMKFVPEVLPILVGTTVDFTNEDDVEHNAFSLSVVKPFDLGLFKRGEDHTVVFDQPGLVKLYCNIHEKMMGYILVLGNPYFAMTDAQGRFTIPDVPPGTYKAVSWYRFGDEAEKEVILTKSKTVEVGGQDSPGGEVDFELEKTHGDPKHKNKWGGEYLGKY